MINSWFCLTPGRPAHCATFQNGDVASQIDFIVTRRRHADGVARQSTPIALDLTPWRLGPKHRAVQASLPWVSGWKVAPKSLKPPRFSLRSLKQGIQQKSPQAIELQRLVEEFVATQPECTIAEFNQYLLPHCQRLFPSRRSRPEPNCQSNAVTAAIERLWHIHGSAIPVGQPGSFSLAGHKWARYSALKQAARALRKAGQAKRRQWLDEQLAEAELACTKGDQGAIDRVVHSLAPKRKRDQVRIRSTQGHLLTVRQEFEEIFEYFSKAFARDDVFQPSPNPNPLVFSASEIIDAVQQLKQGKAVSDTSVPADIWLLCPQAVTSLCVRVFNQCNPRNCSYPTEVTDCALSLLPKPGKTGRRPQDLRPLGLQDPGSKTMAIVLRARAETCVSDFLSTKPQFAYCKGKSIDDAICRVALHCSRVRERLQRGNLSLHDKRSGAQESKCYGGVIAEVVS